MNMFKEFMVLAMEGDPYIICIGLVSVVGVALSIERIVVLFSASGIKKDELLNHINAYILQGNLEKALAVTSQVKSPLTNVIRSGLMAVANNGGPEEVQTAMDAVALREVPRIEKRIGLLATAANISTLFGLLGTVAGLLTAFSSVANVAPAERAAMLSGAISQAMNSTAAGLVVAIPLLGVFGWLSSKAQETIDDMHEASVATLNFILTHKEKLKTKKSS